MPCGRWVLHLKLESKPCIRETGSLETPMASCPARTPVTDPQASHAMALRVVPIMSIFLAALGSLA